MINHRYLFPVEYLIELTDKEVAQVEAILDNIYISFSEEEPVIVTIASVPLPGIAPNVKITPNIGIYIQHPNLEEQLKKLNAQNEQDKKNWKALTAEADVVIERAREILKGTKYDDSLKSQLKTAKKVQKKAKFWRII